MPWIPPKIIPNQPIPGILTGYTNGTIYNMDYTLHLNAIAAEINQVGFMLSPIGAKDVGSAAASLSSTASSTGLLVKQVIATNELLMKLNTNVQLVANGMEVVSRGLATISSHASESVVTQQMAFADQQRNNKHQQLTTEAAQEAAGLKKTEVTPEFTIATIQTTIEEVSVIKAQATAASLVSDAASSAFAYANTTVLKWIAESSVAKWIKSAYGEVELSVKALFAKEKVVAVAVDKAVDANIIMSGNATIPSNFG